jgi:hypothetical protein
MAKEIVIEIDLATGDQTAEAHNYFGKGCDAVLKAFGDGVGSTEKISHKSEFNKPAVHKNMLRQ